MWKNMHGWKKIVHNGGGEKSDCKNQKTNSCEILNVIRNNNF